MTETDELARHRARLPDLTLPSLDGGEPVAVRERRREGVLVLLADPVRERDLTYLRALASAEPMLRDWGARVLVITASDAARPLIASNDVRFATAVDARGVVAAAAGVTPPALVVADQWGEVHAAASAAADTPWLDVAEIEQWVRFLAISCDGG